MSLTVSLHPAPPLPRTTTTYFAASASLAVLQMFRAVLSILEARWALLQPQAVYLVQTLSMLPARQGTADTIQPSNRYHRNKHNVNNGYHT